MTARDIQVLGGNYLNVVWSKAYPAFCPIGPWWWWTRSTRQRRSKVHRQRHSYANASAPATSFRHGDPDRLVPIMPLEPGDLVLTGRRGVRAGSHPGIPSRWRSPASARSPIRSCRAREAKHRANPDYPTGSPPRAPLLALLRARNRGSGQTKPASVPPWARPFRDRAPAGAAGVDVVSDGEQGKPTTPPISRIASADSRASR